MAADFRAVFDKKAYQVEEAKDVRSIVANMQAFGARPMVGTALEHPAAGRLGHSASILARVTRRSPEALARRAAVWRRYHCPSPGCFLNRSRDCTRSRVPPLCVGAMLTLLRVPLSLQQCWIGNVVSRR